MPKMLRTFAEMLRKMNSGLFLEDVSLTCRNGVPEFRSAFMEEVDG